MTTDKKCPDCGFSRCQCPEPDPRREHLALIRNGTWLDAQNFPPLVFVVDGVIPEGLTIIAGAPKAGKSYLMLAIAMAAAVGGTVLGCIEVERRDVLYLALEDGDRRLQKRARAVLGLAPIPESFNRVIGVGQHNALDVARTWLAGLPDDERRCKALIVVDTAQKIRPTARSNATMYADDYAFGTSLKDLASEHVGLAVVAIHHTRKMAAEDFVERASGSNGLTGSADTVVILDRKRTSEVGTLSLVSRDLDSDGVYKIERSGYAWHLVGGSLEESAKAAADHDDDNLGDVSLAVLEHIKQSPGASPSQIKRAIDAPDKAVESAIKRLVDSGRIHRAGRGRYQLEPPGEESLNSELDELLDAKEKTA